MKVLITSEDGDRYSVQNYKLKVLKSNLPDLPPVPQGVQKAVLKELPQERKVGSKDEAAQTETPQNFDAVENDEIMSKEAHNEIVETLLKKADEFSDKYLKAQMLYEDLQESTQKKEADIQKKAYEEGLAEGLKQAKETHENAQNALLEQMQESIRTLDQESEKFSSALHGVKEELIGAALDIAKEVIVKELSDYSSEITISLAEKLIKDIDKESRIQLKVHPSNLEAVQSALSANSHVTVNADSAVQVGGVIIISKLATIEADIMGRYEQIKRSALNP